MVQLNSNSKFSKTFTHSELHISAAMFPVEVGLLASVRNRKHTHNVVKYNMLVTIRKSLYPISVYDKTFFDIIV